MTPSAITPAARGAKDKPSSSAAATATSNSSAPRPRPSRAKRPVSHPTQLRRQGAPRTPRRVSGPLGSAAAAPPRPLRARTRERSAGAPLLRSSAAFLRAIPDHALLDRIIRGRAWIPLLGVLLAGIVAMQVEVLKLNAGIGRSLQHGTVLQSENELLRAQVAGLADDQRIERKAAGMGMIMPAPASIAFLSLGRSVALTRALGDVHQPNPTGFASGLATGSIAAGPPPATGSIAAGAGGPPPATSSTGGAGAPQTAGPPAAVAAPDTTSSSSSSGN